MASIFPNVPGTGNNIPVSTYTAGISESYPNVNRQRVVESSINSKERIDIYPINMGINQNINDKYLEFRINQSTGSFIDLSSLVLEMNINITKADNTPLEDTVNLNLINGVSNTLFKTATVFINDKMVESNPLFNYTSYIKMLKTINNDNLSSLGKCAYFYNDENTIGISKHYVAGTFTAAGTIEGKLSKELKTHGIDVCFPLLLDISSLEMYLLDGIDIRIRLEMANKSTIINSSNNDISDITFHISKARLWLDRVIPHYNAMLALNQALAIKPIEYIFQKTLHKSYVISAGQSTTMIDNPFGMVIPEKLTMLLINMDNYSGRANLNNLYFEHHNISNIHMTINGSTIYNINSDFEGNNYTQLYYETLKAIGLDSNHMITYDSYKSGRSIFVFNFINEPVGETLPIETNASLRINLKFSQNLPSSLIILLFAETTGLLSIDNQRVINCDVRG